MPTRDSSGFNPSLMPSTRWGTAIIDGESTKQEVTAKEINKSIKNINTLLAGLVKDMVSKKHTAIQQADLLRKFHQHLLWFRECGFK